MHQLILEILQRVAFALGFTSLFFLSCMFHSVYRSPFARCYPPRRRRGAQNSGEEGALTASGKARTRVYVLHPFKPQQLSPQQEARRQARLKLVLERQQREAALREERRKAAKAKKRRWS